MSTVAAGGKSGDGRFEISYSRRQCFAQVYKGTLRDGRAVAVKKLDRSGLAGDKQFDIEVNLLNMMRHPNIVNLLGVCTEGTERMAVLEFASKV